MELEVAVLVEFENVLVRKRRGSAALQACSWLKARSEK